MSDTDQLSGIAAMRLAGAGQRDRYRRIRLPINRNFSARAIGNTVMDNRDIIERTVLELIKLYRQLGRRPACGLGARGSRRGDDAAGDNGTATRSAVEITGATPWLWRMADQPGVLDVPAQSQHDKSTAKRLRRKLRKRQRRMPRVMITDKLGGESVAQQETIPGIEHRRHKGSAIGRKSAPVGIMARTAQTKRFTSARQAQHFLPARDQISNLFHSAAIAADDKTVVNKGEPADAHVSRTSGMARSSARSLSAPLARTGPLVRCKTASEPSHNPYASGLNVFFWSGPSRGRTTCLRGGTLGQFWSFAKARLAGPSLLMPPVGAG